MSTTIKVKENTKAQALTPYFQLGAWLLGLAVTSVALIAWGQDYNWKFLPFNAYQIFPLLGLVAFSLMWSHYMIGTIRELVGVDGAVLKSYFRYTGYLVLALICLHPGLLIYQLYHDGAGLPPKSYEHYVAPGLGWITILGSASLLVFLAFEFHRFFEKKTWWHFVTDASDFAMLAIVYHSLRLGNNLMTGWYRFVWYFYAVSLVIVLIRKYYLRLSGPTKKTSPAN